MKQKITAVQKAISPSALKHCEAGIVENQKCHAFVNEMRFQEALISGRKALEHFSKATAIDEGLNSNERYKICLSHVYYNLGVASQTHFEQGLEYYHRAHKLNPENQDAIYQIWNNNNTLSNYKASVKAARKLESPMKDLLIIHSKLLKETIKPEEAILEIKKFTDRPKSTKEQYWFFDVSYYAFYAAGDYEAALAICKSKLEKTNHSIRTLKSLVAKISAIYRIEERYEEGLCFLEQASIDYPEILNSDSTLTETYNQFLLYEYTGNRNKSTKLLEALNKYSNVGLALKYYVDHANEVRFFNELADRNFEVAKIHLKKTSLNEAFYLELIEFQERPVSPSSTGTSSAIYDEGLAVAIIESEEAIANSESKAAAEEKATDKEAEEKAVRIVLNSTPSVSQKEEEPQVEEVAVVKPRKDPRAVNAFINYKKAVVKQKVIVESQFHHKEEFSWKLNDKIISTADKHVYKVGNSENYYVYLPEGICALEQRELFENAIEKGFVSRAFGQAGIKYCKGNGLAEIKIIKKSCVWTDLTLCNGKGKHILIIKYGGTHDAFKLVAPTGKMEVRNVDSGDPHVKEDLKIKQHSKKTKSYLESKENKDADDDDEVAEALEEAFTGNQPMSPDSSVEPTGNITNDSD